MGRRKKNRRKQMARLTPSQREFVKRNFKEGKGRRAAAAKAIADGHAGNVRRKHGHGRTADRAIRLLQAAGGGGGGSSSSSGGGGGGSSSSAGAAIPGVASPAALGIPSGAGTKFEGSAASSFEIPEEIRMRLPKVESELDAKFATSPEQQDLIDKADAAQGKMLDISQELLQGKVPADVQSQVRQMASESAAGKAQSRSQAGRALTLRDLGLTSYDAQARGAEFATKTAQLIENRRQFDQSLVLDKQTFLENVRRGDLSASELELERRGLIDKRNIAAGELMYRSLSTYHELGYGYASNPEANAASAAALARDWGKFTQDIGAGRIL